MFVLGHIGIGRRLASIVDERLPQIALVVGTLLPDLIDKPLYYSRLWSFVNSTRTFGHTGLFLGVLIVLSFALRSRPMKALALGVATHLLLDLLGDIAYLWRREPSASAIALAWPVASSHFVESYMPSIKDHALALITWPTAVGEVVGLGLLTVEWSALHRDQGRLRRQPPV